MNNNVVANKMVKRVRFDKSQQWRLNHRQVTANSRPNVTEIRKNLSQIKRGATPLKRAQAAYYGTANRSPMLAPQNIPKRINHTDGKLPVHARLGNRVATNNISKGPLVPLRKKLPEFNVAQLIAQKRALRLKTIQESKRLRQLQQMVDQTQISNGTMRSDQLMRAQRINRNKKMVRANQIRNNVRGRRPNFPLSAADLSVSVANDLALQHQLLSGNTATKIVKRRQNRLPLHSNEVTPQIQREIAIIQQRNRRMNFTSPPTSDLGINAPTPLQMMKLGGLNNSVLPLGGVTTATPVLVPQVVNGSKISLHERFSML